MVAKPSRPAEREVEALAVRLCRALHRATGGRQYRWQATWDFVKRLDVTPKEAEDALRYAIARRWIDAVGNPIFSAMLLEDGVRRFVEESRPSAATKLTRQRSRSVHGAVVRPTLDKPRRDARR
jgi:hypothetical protein